MSKTTPLDPNVPAGSEDPKLGDNRIRNLAAAVAELINKDHYIGTDGGAGTGYNEDAAGEHNKVTLRTGSAPTVAADKIFLYAKDVSGKAELFCKDEDGDEIQITSGGILNSCNLSGNQTVAGVKTFSSQPVLSAGLTAAAALISTLATGTAPLTVASTTKVSNLNADKWDGKDVPTYTGGESITIPGTTYDVVIKFGAAVSTTDSDETFNFGTAFPNSCVVVFTQNTKSGASVPIGGVTSKSVSGFTLNRNDNYDGSQTFYWLAIGY